MSTVEESAEPQPKIIIDKKAIRWIGLLFIAIGIAFFLSMSALFFFAPPLVVIGAVMYLYGYFTSKAVCSVCRRKVHPQAHLCISCGSRLL